MELTESQKKKLLLAAKVVDDGNMAVLEKIIEFESFIEEKSKSISESLEELESKIAAFKEKAAEEIRGEIDNIKKEAGAKGDPGNDYILTEKDKKEIAASIKVPIVERIETIKEQPIVKEMMQTIKEIKEVAITETPEQIVSKINDSKVKISREQVEGLRDIENIAKANAVPPTTNFFNGLRGKNLNIVGGTATQLGDTVSITTTGSGGGLTPETPVGAVNGVNTVFTVTEEPVFVVSDAGTFLDGAGYTYSALSITMDTPPASFIRSLK